MLYTGVVKFPASTLDHIMKTLFQFIVICKIASMYYILNRTKQVVVRGCQIWAEQVGEEQSISFLRLPHMCTSWYEARHCDEGGHL
jgi:hypothetical protein